MPELKPYEKRVVMHQEYDRCFPSELTIKILSEEEFKDVDLTDFDDIPESLFMAHMGRLTKIKGLTPVKGVRKRDGTKLIDYLGIILDTRYITVDFLRNSMELAQKFESIVGTKLEDIARTSTSEEEFKKRFLSTFLDGVTELSKNMDDKFLAKIKEEAELLRSGQIDPFEHCTDDDIYKEV